MDQLVVTSLVYNVANGTIDQVVPPAVASLGTSAGTSSKVVAC